MQRPEAQIELSDKIVAEALSWVGTPFHHQGRKKGVGVDCVGFLLEIFRPFGIVDFDMDGYARAPDQTLLVETLDQKAIKLDVIDISIIQPVDILLFRIGRREQHVALATDNQNIVHATAKYGVRHHHIHPFRNRLSGIYRVEAFT